MLARAAQNLFRRGPAPLFQGALNAARAPLCIAAEGSSASKPPKPRWLPNQYNKSLRHRPEALFYQRQRWVKQQWHEPKVLHPHARKTKHKGPAPRVTPVWDDPEAATQDAMLQFIDPYERDPELAAPGRRWHAAEIRLKSNEELQKLWIVLMRERNMLHTTRMLHRKRGTKMPYPERTRAVRKSMAMIKVVLGERQREKAVRDARLFEERERAGALKQLDLAAAKVWPPWIPGTDREMPLAANITFNIILRTADGRQPTAKPPPEMIELSLTHDGEPIPDEKLTKHIFLRPAAPTRPSELTYACQVTLAGDAFHSDERKFRPSDTELRPSLPAELSATLYGEPLGDGPVPLLLLPSKRAVRRVKMARINVKMSAKLKKRYAVEDDD